MRSGQPCVVHGVGGLRDTVEHGATGFVFDGATQAEQADNFVAATLDALEHRASDPVEWKAICDQAKEQRFSWALAAERYGDGERYLQIFNANREIIRNPDLIYPGQIFDIPE